MLPPEIARQLNGTIYSSEGTCELTLIVGIQRVLKLDAATALELFDFCLLNQYNSAMEQLVEKGYRTDESTFFRKVYAKVDPLSSRINKALSLIGIDNNEAKRALAQLLANQNISIEFLQKVIKKDIINHDWERVDALVDFIANSSYAKELGLEIKLACMLRALKSNSFDTFRFLSKIKTCEIYSVDLFKFFSRNNKEVRHSTRLQKLIQSIYTPMDRWKLYCEPNYEGAARLIFWVEMVNYAFQKQQENLLPLIKEANFLKSNALDRSDTFEFSEILPLNRLGFAVECGLRFDEFDSDDKEIFYKRIFSELNGIDFLEQNLPIIQRNKYEGKNIPREYYKWAETKFRYCSIYDEVAVLAAKNGYLPFFIHFFDKIHPPGTHDVQDFSWVCHNIAIQGKRQNLVRFFKENGIKFDTVEFPDRLMNTVLQFREKQGEKALSKHDVITSNTRPKASSSV